MKKSRLGLIIVLSSIAALWIIARATNMLQLYSVPIFANYPSMKEGTHFFATNLKKPQRFDFICFYITTETMKKEIRVFRLCGLPGDIIEIKNGRLYVNNTDADTSLSLAHNYKLSKEELIRLRKIDGIKNEFSVDYVGDSAFTYASDKIIQSNAIKAVLQITPKGIDAEGISTLYNEHWNQDNFGPIRVPEGKYFVLGDNRNQAEDSRFRGFVDKTDYITTVIGVK